jgi:hypothetical protein
MNTKTKLAWGSETVQGEATYDMQKKTKQKSVS